ncbi:unnamed protein product, partial [Ilex paraguariensis]
MEASFVSKARTAFHSAAAKAERVFTDIKKSDLITTDRDSDKQCPKTSKTDSSNNEDVSKGGHEVKNLKSPIKIKQDWHERFKNIRIGKKEVQDINKAENSTMSFAIFDENLYLVSSGDVSQSKGSKSGSSVESSYASNTDCIPPTAVMKQLAIAVEAGKTYKTIKDLLASSRDSSPVRERAALNFSAVKSLVLREKEDKFTTEFGADDKILSLINSLLDAEGHFTGSKAGSGLDKLSNITSLPNDIHGAPPESFLVKLSEAIGNLKTLRKMALFWCGVVAELRRLWAEEQHIPGIPPDEIPDLKSCLLYQQLQVINCCLSRKRRHSVATEVLDSVERQASSNVEAPAASEGPTPESSTLYARISTGELVLRMGADKESDNLTMLETGELIYTPVMQEGPLLTEDLIKETEEFVLRTGSVGAGCSQLLSDMQAFKAANPGCVLEDFVRWHSPPDWMEAEASNEAKETIEGGIFIVCK